MATDWRAWHEAYDDPSSPQSRRLGIIRRHISAVLDAAPPGPIQVISMCAGDGRDLLGVLQEHPRRGDVAARLVELDEELAARARAAARAAGTSQVEVVVGDAGLLSAYGTANPADLALVCGVFGNVSDADVRRTVGALPTMCSKGATVIWTRHRRPPDLTPQIRGWFAEAGFEEVAFDAPDADAGPTSRWAWVGVGVHRLPGRPMPRVVPPRMFAFL